MKTNRGMTRRSFIGAVSIAGAVGGCPTASVFAADGSLKETADLVAGPFYPLQKPAEADADMTLLSGRRQHAEGQVVRLTGRVLSLQGTSVRNATIEVWQANANGRYSHPSDPNVQYELDPDFQGYARLRTDGDGRFALTTIKPGPYATQRGDWRAPHIHFEISGEMDRKTTQLFFPGEPLNAQDRQLQSVRRPETLIATIAPSSGVDGLLLASWDIVLASG